MSGNKIWYEWDWETVDNETGDVLDHYHTGSRKIDNEPTCEDNQHTELVLVWNNGNDIDGLEDRSWAYVKDKQLPERFDNGMPVPPRFKTQLERYYSRQ